MTPSGAVPGSVGSEGILVLGGVQRQDGVPDQLDGPGAGLVRPELP